MRIKNILAAIATAALTMGLVAACHETSTPHAGNSTAPTMLGVGAYYRGDRVVAVTTAHFGHDATLTWTPTTTDEHVLLGCSSADIPDEQRLAWFEMVHFDGKVIASSANCVNEDTDDIGTEMQVINVGAKNVGVPTSITARIEIDVTEAPSVSPTSAVPADGLMYLAVTEAVPFDQYPLPADPHVLPVLNRRDLSGFPGSNITATFLGPNGSTSLTVPAGYYTLRVNSQTPGVIHINVDGKPLQSAEFWDYHQQLCGYMQWPLGTDADIANGTGTVTITVSAEHVTGDWFVAVTPDAPASAG